MKTTNVPIMPVPFDLYRDIHKAIRVVMFEVTAEAGRLDPSDTIVRARTTARVRELVRLLQFHALHEDDHIEAAVRKVLPERAAEIASDHVALEARMSQLVAFADAADAADAATSEARGAVHCLYLELASFVAAYLAHQDTEERIVMPALWDAFGIEVPLTIHNTILSAISPDDMGWALSMMLPAMNNPDRIELLGSMRAEAPSEIFEAVYGLASQVLDAGDFATVSARLGATLESVG